MVCFQGWFAFVHIALVSGVISVSILQCSRRPTVSKGIFKVDSRVGFNDGSNYLLYQHVQFIPPTVCQLLKGFALQYVWDSPHIYLTGRKAGRNLAEFISLRQPIVAHASNVGAL